MDLQAEFLEKQAKMREQVLKFEKFIQENDAKRVRAEAKAKQVSAWSHTRYARLHVCLKSLQARQEQKSW